MTACSSVNFFNCAETLFPNISSSVSSLHVLSLMFLKSFIMLDICDILLRLGFVGGVSRGVSSAISFSNPFSSERGTDDGPCSLLFDDPGTLLFGVSLLSCN